MGLFSRSNRAASVDGGPGKGKVERGRGVAAARDEPRGLLACLPLAAVEAFRARGLRAGRSGLGGGGLFRSHRAEPGGIERLSVNGNMLIGRAKSEDDMDKVGLI